MKKFVQELDNKTQRIYAEKEELHCISYLLNICRKFAFFNCPTFSFPKQHA